MCFLGIFFITTPAIHNSDITTSSKFKDPNARSRRGGCRRKRHHLVVVLFSVLEMCFSGIPLHRNTQKIPHGHHHTFEVQRPLARSQRDTAKQRKRYCRGIYRSAPLPPESILPSFISPHVMIPVFFKGDVQRMKRRIERRKKRIFKSS